MATIPQIGQAAPLPNCHDYPQVTLWAWHLSPRLQFFIPAGKRSVRPADLLSVVMRLEYTGLATNAELQQFRAGKLPKAS